MLSQFPADHVPGLGHPRRSACQVVRIRPKKVDPPLLQKPDGLVPAPEAEDRVRLQEVVRVRLHQHVKIQKFVPDLLRLLGVIPLDVRHQDRELPAECQVADLPHPVLLPFRERHLQKQQVRPLQAQRRKALQPADPGEIKHFRAEENPRRVVRQNGLQKLIRLLPPFQIVFRCPLGHIEVRSGTDRVHTLAGELLDHAQAHLHIAAPVVDPGKNVAVKINHSSSS